MWTTLDHLEHALHWPAGMDVLLAYVDAHEIYAALADDGRPIARIRRAQAAAALGEAGAVEGLALIEGLDDAPVEGVRRLLWGTLREWRRIDEARFRPRGRSTLYQEELAHARYVESAALAQLGLYTAADAARQSAIDQAEILGMPRRLLTLNLEAARVDGLRGNLDPEGIDRRVRTATIPVTPMQFAWAKRSQAEQWLASGHYLRAFEAVQNSTDARSTELRSFCEALLGRTTPDQTFGGGDYGRLASAVTQLVHGNHDVTLTEPPNAEPQGWYARLLIAGATMLQAAMPEGPVRVDMTRRAVARLDEPPRTHLPDQRVYWAASRLAAHVDGASHRDPLWLVGELREAVHLLSTPQYVMNVLTAISPNAAALVAVLPGMPPAVAAFVDRVPLLAGRTMHYQGTAYRMNARRLGILEVLQELVPSYVDPEYDTTPTSTERKKFDAKIAEYGLPKRYANLGWVIRGLMLLEDAAQQAPPLPITRPAQFDLPPWQAVRVDPSTGVVRLLCPEVTRRLRQEAPHVLG